MRHGVLQRQLPQTAQRFFTLFYHLNRPQATQTPSCSRLLSSSRKTQLAIRHTVGNPSPTAARRTSHRSGRIRYSAPRPSEGPTKKESKLSTDSRSRDGPAETRQVQVAYDASLESLRASVMDAERAAAVARRALRQHQTTVKSAIEDANTLPPSESKGHKDRKSIRGTSIRKDPREEAARAVEGPRKEEVEEPSPYIPTEDDGGSWGMLMGNESRKGAVKPAGLVHPPAQVRDPSVIRRSNVKILQNKLHQSFEGRSAANTRQETPDKPGGPTVTVREHSPQESTELEVVEPKGVQQFEGPSSPDTNPDLVARSKTSTEAETLESKTSPDLKVGKVPLDRQLISVFRCMPHSVVVITACPPDYDHAAGDFTRLRYEAMTASSLTSVSMQGTPVISFNVRSPSRTLEAIRHWRTFRVHILRDDVSAAKIAHAFSTGDAKAAFDKVSHDPELKCNIMAPTVPREADQRTCMAPKLIHESVVARLDCNLRDPEVVVCDHVVLFGDVERITVPRAMIGSSLEQPILMFDGLAYAQKAYGAPGRVTFDPSRPEVVRNDSESVIGG